MISRLLPDVPRFSRSNLRGASNPEKLTLVTSLWWWRQLVPSLYPGLSACCCSVPLTQSWVLRLLKESRSRLWPSECVALTPGDSMSKVVWHRQWGWAFISTVRIHKSIIHGDLRFALFRLFTSAMCLTWPLPIILRNLRSLTAPCFHIHNCN